MSSLTKIKSERALDYAKSTIDCITKRGIERSRAAYYRLIGKDQRTLLEKLLNKPEKYLTRVEALRRTEPEYTWEESYVMGVAENIRLLAENSDDGSVLISGNDLLEIRRYTSK